MDSELPFVKISKICGKHSSLNVWFVRVLSSDLWYSRYENAPADLRLKSKEVFRLSQAKKREGVDLVRVAILVLDSNGNLMICEGMSAFFFNAQGQLEILCGATRNPLFPDMQLSVLRWFLFELCGLEPWGPVIAGRAMDRLRIPLPKLDSADWARLAVHPARKPIDDYIGSLQQEDPDRSVNRTYTMELAVHYLHALKQEGLLHQVLTSSYASDPVRFNISTWDGSTSHVLKMSWDGDWLVSTPESVGLASEFGRSRSILETLKKGLVLIPVDEWDAWYDANVAQEGQQVDDICEVVLDIDCEPYLLLESTVPYLFPDKGFLEFIGWKSP